MSYRGPVTLGEVSASPIASICGLSTSAAWSDADCASSADAAAMFLTGKEAACLGDDFRRRISQYYLPVLHWLEKQLRSRPDLPLTVGVSAIQGSGKTTLCSIVEHVLSTRGWGVQPVSLDDFYKTRQDQAAYAAAHSENELVQVRGNAGTHDLALATQTLHNLCAGAALSEPPEWDRVPRYDKGAFGGLGDRVPRDAFGVPPRKLHLILLEGWMLGFEPVAEARAASVHAGLPLVNAALQEYASLWRSVDCWVVLRAAPELATRWRLEAEQAQRAAGKGGMNDEQVRRFVQVYLPAYAAYLPGLYAQKDGFGPLKAPLLSFDLDEERRPIASPVPS